MVAVFVGYVLWDLVTDILMGRAASATDGRRRSSSSIWIVCKATLIWTFASWACLLLSVLPLLVAPAARDVWSVVSVDAALLALALAFRALKSVERMMGRWWLSGTRFEYRNTNATYPRRWEWIRLVVCLFVFAASLVAVAWL